MSFDKSIEHFSEDDLVSLVTTTARNAMTLDLRPDLPKHTNAGKIEFLNEVASFANALGGHMLYGVNAANGAPAELAGLEPAAVTGALEWMERSAWEFIVPRVTGLRCKVVVLRNGKSVLALRIPKTVTSPHMVTFQEANKFYSRNPMGKYPLEVEELRAAFSSGEMLKDKMRAFRMERLYALLNRTLSIALPDAPKLALHILPMRSFEQGFRINLEQATEGGEDALRPMASRGMVSQFNYDGLLTFSSMEKYAYSHLQVFRNGCIEAADSSLLAPKDGKKFLTSPAFEKEIIECGGRMLALLRRLKISPPYTVALSFLGVRDYTMFVGAVRWQPSAHPVEREHLYLDEVVIDDAAMDFGRAIRPALDQLWNACGWPRSLNYDEQGNWRENAA